MSGENYDEGVERVPMAGARFQSSQSALRRLQALRLREKVIGTLVALSFVLVLLVIFKLMAWGKTDASKALKEADEALRKGAYEQVLSHADNALEYENYAPEAHLFSAYAYIFLGQYEKAIQETDKAIALTSDELPEVREYWLLKILLTPKEKGIDVALDQFAEAVWEKAPEKPSGITSAQIKKMDGALKAGLLKMLDIKVLGGFCLNKKIPGVETHKPLKLRLCLGRTLSKQLADRRRNL
ncbi:tetratricopeptide repeat protein [Sneathiella limimaris]|uniref:tetratricopeptide repeat protein n=1 Tax=Sneathiella limimaris TaxID=1964213 RepID=UPI00146EDDAC|nr:tetratricopeptide repeat protein [Sneathiella limimaris]